MSSLHRLSPRRRPTGAHRRNSLSLCSYNGSLRHTRLGLEALEPRVMLDAEGNALIGVERFRADPQYAGIDGSGYAIAIIDTGIDLDHPFFGPDENEDGIRDRIVYQENFFDDTLPAEDNVGHGTLVASIAAGYHEDDGILPDYSGVAPGADLVILKALDNGQSVAQTNVAIEKALQRVLDLINAPNPINIVAVNLSFNSGGQIYSTDTFGETPEELNTRIGVEDEGGFYLEEIEALEAAGVLVTASAGNSFGGEEYGITFPGADLYSLSVGTVWDEAFSGTCANGQFVLELNGKRDCSTAPDRISVTSKREVQLLDALAPGALISGAGLNGTFLSDDVTTNAEKLDITGTSFAAPHIAFVAVLAKQMVDTFGDMLGVQNLRNNEDATDMNIGFKRLVKSTGVPVVDGDDEVTLGIVPTGATFPRVNLAGLTIAGEPTGLANRLVPPRVKDVIIGSTFDSRTYSFAAHVGSDEQLKTIPVANPNKITIEFTELVTGLTTANLSLDSLFAGSTYTVSQGPTIDSFHSATWEFASPFGADQIELTLQAVGVKEYLHPNEELINPWYQSPVPANILDGNWLNPTSLSDPTGDFFPSGDKIQGGNFVFRFTVLPGDATRDNVVNLDDLNTVRNNWGQLTTDWIVGEMTGDGVVNLDDRNEVANHFGLNFTVWPGGGAQAASSGGGGVVLSDAQRYELFVQALAQIYAAERQESDVDKIGAARRDAFWASVGADKELLEDVLDRVVNAGS